MHQLHGEVEFALAVATDLVGRDCVRMLQQRGDSGLTQQTLLLNRIIRKFRPQGFVANNPRKMQVFARHDQRFAAARNGLEVGIAGAVVNALG